MCVCDRPLPLCHCTLALAHCLSCVLLFPWMLKGRDECREKVQVNQQTLDGRNTIVAQLWSCFHDQIVGGFTGGKPKQNVATRGSVIHHQRKRCPLWKRHGELTLSAQPCRTCRMRILTITARSPRAITITSHDRLLWQVDEDEMALLVMFVMECSPSGAKAVIAELKPHVLNADVRPAAGCTALSVLEECTKHGGIEFRSEFKVDKWAKRIEQVPCTLIPNVRMILSLLLDRHQHGEARSEATFLQHAQWLV